MSRPLSWATPTTARSCGDTAMTAPATTVLEGLVWLTYVTVCLLFYFRPAKRATAPAPKSSVTA